MSAAEDEGALARATLQASGGECEPGDPSDVPRPRRGTRPDDATYERWLAKATERVDPLMAFLGIAFAMLVAFELSNPGLSSSWSRALTTAGLVIWGLFIVDFVARALLAPSRLRFVRRHWLAVLMLLVPTLRILRLGALLRLGRALPAARVLSSSYRATGVARSLLGSRTGYLAGLASISTLAIAQLTWLAERGEGTFDTFGDALIWAATCVLGMQANPYPETTAGRLITLAAFAVGLVIIAALAGAVATFLLESRRERDAETGVSRRSDP